MNEEFLMSSLFLEAELQLTYLGLAAIADFFALEMAKNQGFGKVNNDQKVHAVLLDIDHSQSFWLNA